MDLSYQIIFCLRAQYSDKNHNVNKQLIFRAILFTNARENGLRYELTALSL